MKDFLQINKLAELHNDDTIIFCKTDYLPKQFQVLKHREKPVVVISGNSDYSIHESHLQHLPNCVVKWFCQNYIGPKKDIITTIPLGIENSYAPSKNHLGWQSVEFSHKAKIQIDLLSKSYDIKPSKFAYVNFRNRTNPHHRQQVKLECSKYRHFTTGKEIDFQGFVSDILDHECVVCAQGNDMGDNIRIYETLYLKRIPILFNKFMHRSLHHNFPHIMITDMSQLGDLDWLQKQKKSAYERASSNWIEMLNSSYWLGLIKKEAEKIS